MTNCEFTVVKEGTRGYYITLPCFCSDSDFYDAKLMNNFYTKVMGELYNFANAYISEAERRVRFTCTYTVDETDNGINVTLQITLKTSGSSILRRNIVHAWSNGRVIKRTHNI